jgi:hypothetical protein
VGLLENGPGLPCVISVTTVSGVLLLYISSLNGQKFAAEQLLPWQAGRSIRAHGTIRPSQSISSISPSTPFSSYAGRTPCWTGHLVFGSSKKILHSKENAREKHNTADSMELTDVKETLANDFKLI